MLCSGSRDWLTANQSELQTCPRSDRSWVWEETRVTSAILAQRPQLPFWSVKPKPEKLQQQLRWKN